MRGRDIINSTIEHPAKSDIKDRVVPRSFPLERIRNIGIIAHIDAGKTTVTERILYFTGKTYKIGEVDEGTTVMDFMEQERRRGITIKAAATTCYWREHRINIIDTPGHVDFTAEVERSLRILDGGVVVFDAVAGVEAQSETVWRQANKYHVPRICFINKMDRPGADFKRAIGMIEQRLQAKPIPIHLPIGNETSFQGIIDLVEEKALGFDESRDSEPVVSPIPDEYRTKASEARQSLIEKLAESDDQFMAAYLEGRQISSDEIKQALRRVTLAGKGVPVISGSAIKNAGIRPLLNAIVDYLPSPLDMPPVKASDYRRGTEVTCPINDEATFAALVFKVVSDPFMGRLVYLRVYSGKIKNGAQVFNSTTGDRERIGRLFLMHANHREEIEEADTGSIVAAQGLKNTFTADTLCEPSRPVLLESIRFPQPVISVAIEPRTRADHDKMGEALQKLAEEDPTFKVTYNQETGQTIIAGMGELHLEVLMNRLFSEFGVGAIVGKPQVAYKETITVPVKVEGRFVRQTGGHGQYGDIWMEFQPLERGGGFQFENRLKGGVIPREYIPAVEQGVKESLEAGGIVGYPVVDIKAVIYDGSYHEVDSSELAFKLAGSMAVKNGIPRAKPIILEPIMKLEVATPEEFLGDIIGDLNARRGHIEAIEMQGDTRVIRALIPLAETFGYATSLRSLSQGRATHSMEFYQYQELPAQLAEKIAKSTFTRR